MPETQRVRRNAESRRSQCRAARLRRHASRIAIAAALIGLPLSFAGPGALAQSTAGQGGKHYVTQLNGFESALAQTTFHGMAGFMNFEYLHHPVEADHARHDTHSVGFGGHFVLHTGALHGFSVGFAGYTGQSLNIYDRNALGYDSELTGSHYGIQSFRQAYLQFQNAHMTLRGGRQLINTPWAREDYYTFNPRAFMGLAGVFDVIGKGPSGVRGGALSLADSPAAFSIFAARMFTYESRYSSSFTDANRYSGGMPTNGFVVVGARYQHHFGPTHVAVQAWYYDFYQYAQLFYGEANASRPIGHGRSVFGAVQLISEGNSSGDGLLRATGGQAGSVDAHIYGAKLGISFGPGGHDSVALVGDYNPINKDSFRHGGMVHPYNDLSGTFFTDTMQTGLGDMGPGYAYGVDTKFAFLRDKLDVGVNFIRYLARYGYGNSVYGITGEAGYPAGVKAMPNQKMWAMDVGASYDLSAILKGLSIAEDTDIAVAQNRAGYPHYQNPWFSSRFYLEYKW